MRMQALGWCKDNKPIVLLVVATLLLTLIPALEIYAVLGHSWRGIVPIFTDENFYIARIMALVHGHATTGNPYFLEHADGPPLVIFAGVWINALPFLLGAPMLAALYINFVLWSLAFVAAAYLLLRELSLPRWGAVFGTLALYVDSYAHVWRPVNLQPVYPIYFLFYLALARFMKAPTRRAALFLGAMMGLTFYLYAYLWQATVITLGLLLLWALVRKEWLLAKETFFAGLVGGIIGSPVVLYALWLSHTSPYFWESVYRLGLVNTHLPEAEIIYSGGWIGLLLALVALLYWRVPTLRENKECASLATFFAISGFGLWVAEGSNVLSGKWLETGAHVKLLILAWLLFASVSLATFLWRERIKIHGALRAAALIVFAALAVVQVYFLYQHDYSFLPNHLDPATWQEDETYAKPLAWLNAQPPGAVVWSDPNAGITSFVPLYTQDFVLYHYFGMLELVPEGEIHERYLVSQYFNNPSLADLQSYDVMNNYLGRHDVPHEAKTLERAVKFCRAFFFWDKSKNCGSVPTVQSLKGDQFFADLEAKFQSDLKPNIQGYLAKYHVTYVLKDKILDAQYHPEALGATRVYSDERFEIYKLQP